MASRFDRLLEAIHPVRTFEEVQRCADQAINSLPMNVVRIANFTEFQEFVEKVHRHVESSILRLIGGMPQRDLAFSWGQCVPMLNEAFDCSEGWKPAFEMARTGNEGGLRAVVYKIAEAISRRYAKEWVAGLVWNYWNSLSVTNGSRTPCSRMLAASA
ncbi:MAG: hypothetical protein V1790_09535 [Planctomycetota bacterium]